MSTKRKTPSERVIASFARNGMNTLLLDIKEDLGGVRSDVAYLTAAQIEAVEFRRELRTEMQSLNSSLAKVVNTVDRIDPVVAVLNLAHQQKIGLTGLFKKVHAVWLLVGGGVVAGLHWITGWPKLP